MRIEGATIVLTGASSGIGEALAPLLAARGATVGLAARRADRLEATLARCVESAPESRSWTVDLSDVDAAVGFVEEAWDHFGGIDCLVNNAAVGMRKLLLDHTPDDLDHVMRTNFVSPVRMCLAVVPRMVERGSGTVVNIGSAGGRFGIAHESAYCAAKFALSGWTEVAAIDLADTPVDVKLVQPGAIATEIWEQRPGELPGLPGATFMSAEDCAAGIADALEADGFEFFVPNDIEGMVEFKNADVQGWVDLMAGLGRAKLSGAG